MREAASAVFLFASAASPNFAPAATVPASARSTSAPVAKSAVDAPGEPSADLIEFIGEWSDDKGDTVDPAAFSAAQPMAPPASLDSSLPASPRSATKPASAAEHVIDGLVIDAHD